MNKSLQSSKTIQKDSINPQQTATHITTAKSINLLKQQQSSPIQQHNKLSIHQIHYLQSSFFNNAQSQSNQLLKQHYQKQQFNVQTYRFSQSYFTIKDLLQQQNYQLVQKDDFIYAGGMKDQCKHGWGILISKNTTYEGRFSLNHKNGKGFIHYPNNSKYFGDFSNDKPHGHGMLIYGNQYYIGDFQNGMMQGDGLWKNQKLQKYIGKWKNNKAHGYGIYQTENSHYQGEFSTFEKHGYGIETFVNGDLYKGNYSHGKPNGYGEYVWKNNASYKGNLANGLKQGQGVWINQVQDQYNGSFYNDKKHGHGIYKWANGNIYQGQFFEDMRHGTGNMAWNDGSTYQGEWSRGLPNGKGLYKVIGQKPKYGIFQDNVLVQQLRSYSLPKQKSSLNKKIDQLDKIQKSKLYLNIIPQYPKKRNISSSREINNNNIKINSLHKSTVGSFKISTHRKSLTWRKT